jgi:hypothetical protein
VLPSSGRSSWITISHTGRFEFEFSPWTINTHLKKKKKQKEGQEGKTGLFPGWEEGGHKERVNKGEYGG